VSETKEERETREWEEERARLAASQNLPEGAVPEQRPQATIQPAPVEGEVHKRLVEEGSPLVNTEPMGKEAYDRAASDQQARKAAKDSMGPERLFPGAHCYIDNPDGEGKEHHGRAVAVNGVHEFEDGANAILATLGTPDARFAKVKSYECFSRDGRAEHMIVSAEHLRRVPVTEFNRTPA
jgi:hypothetical protein